MTREEKIAYIREITPEEGKRIIDCLTEILYGKEDRCAWGGLFLFKGARRGRRERYWWVAIDDTDGNGYIEQFRSKKKAIDWLVASDGPKLCRL